MQILILSIILLFPIIAASQTTLPTPESKTLFPIWGGENVHFNGGIKNLKWGFIDVHGNVVIQPEFESIGEFSEGLAPAKLKGKWGYINQKGEIKIPFFLNAPYNFPQRGLLQFSEGLAAVREGRSGCGYINKNGGYAIRPIKNVSECGRFKEGLAMIKICSDCSKGECKDCKTGYIDTQGNWAIPPTFVGVYGFENWRKQWDLEPSLTRFDGDFVNGLTLVTDGAKDSKGEFKYFLIDKKGNRVNNKKDCQQRYEFSEGLRADSQTNYLAPYFIDQNCEKVLNPSEHFERAKGEYSYRYRYSDFSDGLAVVRRSLYQNGEYTWRDSSGFIDKTGKLVIPFKYYWARPFSDGLAIVQDAPYSTPYYINKKGEPFFEPNLVSWGSSRFGPAPFKNGLASQTIKGRHARESISGYMNKQGKYVWLSSDALEKVGEAWIKKYYIGSQKFE